MLDGVASECLSARPLKPLSHPISDNIQVRRVSSSRDRSTEKISTAAESVRARSAHDDPEVEGEVLELPPLTSENEEKCGSSESGGVAPLTRIPSSATKVLQA
jgi:hypothetical protein